MNTNHNETTMAEVDHEVSIHEVDPTPDIFPTLCAIQTESWRDTYKTFFPSDFLEGRMHDDMLRAWTDNPLRPTDICITAKLGPRIVGFVTVHLREYNHTERYCEGDEGIAVSACPYIDHLHVLPELRGKGIGSRLLRAAGKAVIAKKGSGVSDNNGTGVWLWVFERHEPAIRLYERLGAVRDKGRTNNLFGFDIPVARMRWKDCHALAKGGEVASSRDGNIDGNGDVSSSTERSRQPSGSGAATFTCGAWSTLHAFGSRPLLHCLKLLPTRYADVVYYFDQTVRKGNMRPPNNTVVLTIDDAPGTPQLTMQVLDALQALAAKATFFIIESYTAQPGRDRVMRRIVSDGHGLGNHMVLDAKTTKMTDAEFEAALLQCEQTLCRYDGSFATRRPKWFRPPMGILTHRHILKKHDYTVVLGDVYPNDVAVVSKPKWIEDFVVSKAQPGSIIIQHSPDVENCDRKTLGTAIANACGRLKSQRGFNITSLQGYSHDLSRDRSDAATSTAVPQQHPKVDFRGNVITHTQEETLWAVRTLRGATRPSAALTAFLRSEFERERHGAPCRTLAKLDLHGADVSGNDLLWAYYELLLEDGLVSSPSIDQLSDQMQRKGRENADRIRNAARLGAEGVDFFHAIDAFHKGDFLEAFLNTLAGDGTQFADWPVVQAQIESDFPSRQMHLPGGGRCTLAERLAAFHQLPEIASDTHRRKGKFPGKGRRVVPSPGHESPESSHAGICTLEHTPEEAANFWHPWTLAHAKNKYGRAPMEESKIPSMFERSGSPFIAGVSGFIFRLLCVMEVDTGAGHSVAGAGSHALAGSVSSAAVREAMVGLQTALVVASGHHSVAECVIAARSCGYFAGLPDPLQDYTACMLDFRRRLELLGIDGPSTDCFAR